MNTKASLELNLGLTIGVLALTASIIYLEGKNGSRLHSPIPGILTDLVAITMLAASMVSEALGAHGIFVAFLAGVILSQRSERRDLILKKTYPLAMSILAPVYFASIGLKANFITNFDLPIVLLVFIVACAGKILGAGFGAWASGMLKREALAIGFGMNARGAMEIVLASAAMDYGLIDQHIFVALVVMALAKSMISGSAIQRLISVKPFYEGRPMIKCVAGGHVEGTLLIGGKGYRAKGSINETLTQFRGRTIGTPRRGSIHDVILRKLVNDSGLGDDIAIKNFDWADFILDAMIDGEVDGGCGTPPLAVLAMRQMNARIIIPPSAMWPYNPSYGIVAIEGLIHGSGSSSTLEDFLRLHEDACNLIRERPEEAADLVHRALEFIEKDFAIEVFKVSPKYCASLPAEYVDSSMAFVPVLREMGYLARDLMEEDVFFTRAIKKVHPGKHHYGDR